MFWLIERGLKIMSKEKYIANILTILKRIDDCEVLEGIYKFVKCVFLKNK